MTDWFEDESFWITMYPLMFPSKRFAQAEEQVEKVLKLVNFEGHSVLDLCCGPGRHSVVLAHRGLDVTAVDLTPYLLEKARERAVAEKVQVEWILEDMRRFVREDSYDLVLNLFTSFGYFDKEEENLKVLDNIYCNLRADGSCVIDVVSKEWLAKVFQPTSSTELEDGTLWIQRHEVIKDWTRIRNEWIVIKDGQTHSFKFSTAVYSGQEMKDRLGQVGFKEIKLYGGFDGREYGREGSRLVVTARKN